MIVIMNVLMNRFFLLLKRFKREFYLSIKNLHLNQLEDWSNFWGADHFDGFFFMLLMNWVNYIFVHQDARYNMNLPFLMARVS